MQEKKSRWAKLPLWVKAYIIFCGLSVGAVAFANHYGFYPTYGIFSGENSWHSSSHGHAYYGIHGK